jgi:hypothetical protein
MRRRSIWFIFCGLVALALGGIAVAGGGGAQTDDAAATFSASEVKRFKSRTCTGADGEYRVTHAVLLGKVESTTDPILAGALKLKLKSVYNLTENLGWVVGTAHIRNDAVDPDTRARATFKAVNVNGAIEGMFVGGAGAPHWRLLANFSASLNQTDTTAAITNGTIGAASSSNSALLFRGGCKHKEDEPVTATQRGEKPHGEGRGKGKDKP